MQLIDRSEDELRQMSNHGEAEYNNDPSEQLKLNIPWQTREQLYGH